VRGDSRPSSSAEDAVGKDIRQGGRKEKKIKKTDNGPHLSVSDLTFYVSKPYRKWVSILCKQTEIKIIPFPSRPRNQRQDYISHPP
jgi:hypothetical protein